jgi:glycosyltransferase involved in cell wall biosynthesis
MQILGEDAIGKSVLDFKPDLIYSDTPLHAASIKLFSLSARKSIPFIIHLRGDWWREYYSWFASASWPKRFRSAQQYSYNWFSLLTSRKITPICKWLERIVNHHLPRKPTEVVYQGIAPTEFDQTTEQFNFQRPSIAIIQNHTVYPKVAGLLKLRPVIQRLPSVHFYITEGEKYDQRYAPLVKGSMGNCSNVHFVNGIDNPNAVRKMLNSVDCYILATELDCCPTTVLEASLMQKPVIASRVGGVPEIVLENRTGWTIPNDSTAEWVDRITQILSDRKLRDTFGRTGREWVSEKFGWNNIAMQVEKLILDQVTI